jgi:hypothetical protein
MARLACVVIPGHPHHVTHSAAMAAGVPSSAKVTIGFMVICSPQARAEADRSPKPMD